jgi:hypothetical protein
MSIVILLAGIGSHGMAQDSNHEHIQALKPFVGQWTDKLTEDGTELNLSCQWAANRSYLRFSWTAKAEGGKKATHMADLYVGYNGKTGDLHHWTLRHDLQSDGPAAIEGNVLKVMGSGAHASGAAAGAELTFILEGDTLMVVTTGRVTGDKKHEDRKLAFTRKG